MVSFNLQSLTPIKVVNFFLIVATIYIYNEFGNSLLWIALATVTFWITYHNFLGTTQKNLPNQETTQELLN